MSERMAQIGERVHPDGTSEAITVPAIGAEAVMEDVADHLRAVVAMAGLEADTYRVSHPERARQAALVRTHAQTALIWALFGDRVG